MATTRKTADQLAREAGERQPRSGITPVTTAPKKSTKQSSTRQTSTQTTATTPAPAPAVPQDWEKAARELYGGYYAIVEGEPELKDLLFKAAQQGYTREQFEYELRQTAWYRNNAASAREWQISSQVDPATAEQNIQNRQTYIQNVALNNFNVQIGDDILRRLATDSLKFGWNEALISNAVGLEATKSSAGVSQLASGYLGQNVKEIANQYGLKLTDQNLGQWTASIATGQQTRDTFKQYAIQQAKQLFPSIATQLDAGQTFQQIVDPYRNTAANLLEMNANMIDFTDPKWAKAITFVDQSGNQRPMSFSEWNDYLRQNRSFGYEYTSDAQSKAYQVANDLANLFGKV